MHQSCGNALRCLMITKANSRRFECAMKMEQLVHNQIPSSFLTNKICHLLCNPDNMSYIEIV